MGFHQRKECSALLYRPVSFALACWLVIGASGCGCRDAAEEMGYVPPAGSAPEAAPEKNLMDAGPVNTTGGEGPVQIVQDDVSAESLGAGIQRIRIALVNDGDMPTLTAMGRESRTVRPIAVRIDVPIERILNGSRIVLIRGLDGKGARRSIEWLIRTDDTPVTVNIDDPANGTRTMMITPQEGTSR